MTVSKSIRFEVFARDSFTCQYCGRRPPEVVLELDHIHPQARGGSDELTNLLTACDDCNRGKSAKIISEIAPRPDADLMFLRAQQEIAEAERYLVAKKKRDEVLFHVQLALSANWEDCISEQLPPPAAWQHWIRTYGPQELEIAINTCSDRAQYTDLGEGSSHRRMIECSKYVSGILKKRRKDANVAKG